MHPPWYLPLSVQRHLLPLLLFFLYFRCLTSAAAAEIVSTVPQEIHRGFSATSTLKPPSPLPASSPSSSSVSFQPILADPTGNFSLGFLLASPPDLLDLAVVHLPSALVVWRASPTNNATARWSDSTSFSFNGTLLLSDNSRGSVLWSAASPAGDRVVLLNSSNLQIQNLAGSVLWQSFDSPVDTLVQDQNFTASTALFSGDRRFSMRLGSYYLALYMVSGAGGSNPVMYWKETALEERAEIVEGAGPIYARVDQLGFLGMYQNETARVHLLAFDSFNRGIHGFRRLTLESDGNLRAYYWNASNWISDYRAISDACELPTHCGAYGLCTEGKEECGCLDGSRTGNGCLPAEAGDLCGDTFWELRWTGVELSYKKLLGSEKVGSQEECEVGCKHKCSCWGALYDNATGYCYRMDYPVETLLATGDDNRVGYFKVRVATGGGEKKGKRGPFGGGVPVLVVGLLVFAGVTMFCAYRVWGHSRRSRGGASGTAGEDISPGPYKAFKDSASFRAIELSISGR